MRNVDTILFDWGNTLVDYPLGARTDQLDFIDRFVSSVLPREKFDIFRDQEQWIQMMEKLNYERKDHRTVSFLERFAKIFPNMRNSEVVEIEKRLCDAIFGSSTAFEDSMKCLQLLLSHGYRLGIVSNLPWGTSPAIWVEEFSRHLGDLFPFLTITTCGDAGWRKPHPRPLLHCIENASSCIDRSVFVGDSVESDIGAANAAGVRGVLIRNVNDLNCTKILHYPDLSSFVAAVV